MLRDYKHVNKYKRTNLQSTFKNQQCKAYNAAHYSMLLRDDEVHNNNKNKTFSVISMNIEKSL